MEKIVYLIIILVISSCTYQIDCPGFPEKYLNWIPYIQGEEFSFTDGTDTFQFKVELTDITKPYTVKRSKFLNDWEYSCDCQANFTITTTNEFFQTIYIGSNNTGNYTSGFFITFETPYFPDKNQFFGFQENNGDTIFSTLPYEQVEIISSYDNSFKVFNDVLKIESDTLLSGKMIYQIFIAEKIGIIQFKDRFSHKTWSLIE